jgi:hypothetical protein
MGEIVAIAVGAECGVGVGVGVGAGLIVKVTVLVPVPLALVAERMTLLYVPAVVGVPEINPLFEGPVKPGGLLVAPQLPLGMAWFAVIWYESATPTVPVLSPLVMVGAGVGVGGGLIVIVSGLVSLPFELVAVMVAPYVPAVVGVPEITPVVELKPVKPGAGGIGLLE